MNFLVTGSAGMIGSYVVKGLIDKGHTVIGVDRRRNDNVNVNLNENDNVNLNLNHNVDLNLNDNVNHLVQEFKGSKVQDSLEQVVLDLSDKEAIIKLFEHKKIDRCIHLAALAHTAGMKNLTWEVYYKINVECAENVFEACARHEVPVLFISTVDAIGMVKGVITPDTELNPISNYGKSKAMAEGRLKEICKAWNIYRFSPVYTPDVKRDIEKRYYLKYPNWAYKIGKGGQFEVLNVTGAVAAMVDWVDKEVDNSIHVIKDPELLDINKLIAAEKAEGRAKHVLCFPRWMVVCGYYMIKSMFGKSNKTYLVFKALWPFRTNE